jgi:nitrogen fixation protein FixH
MTPKYEVTSSEKKFTGWHLLIAIVALSIGSLFGPLQAFEHAGLDL